MADMSILLADTAQNLPERELWSRINTARARRLNALDNLQHAIRVHGKDLNGEQLGALLAALNGMRLTDDGAAENEVGAYLAAEAARKLKGK